MTDALEQVLRLVAEGRLTAEEAGPILAALEPEPAAEAAHRTDQPAPDRTRAAHRADRSGLR